MREATPGAMRLPQGAKDRERLLALEDRVKALEAKAQVVNVSNVVTAPIGEEFERAVLEVIQKHMRPGGLLNPDGKHRPGPKPKVQP